ncbi:TSC22 domain family protein 1 isoform X3 [Apus apus]|uniref:TSC22 domain family protein 1 isoform X3 n=1 Tax=Apus apus TaxID=8895 RepID=UPI0021F8F08D|nr:TSC22 domain family protein 1 isoform X3 [Apus apus]
MGFLLGAEGCWGLPPQLRRGPVRAVPPCAERWRCRHGNGRRGRAPAGGAGSPPGRASPPLPAPLIIIIIIIIVIGIFKFPLRSRGWKSARSSGASVVAIDNKIEQAMDLVKSHLMYAVREEVEVLKEQIKELIEKNSQLEQENTLLKTLASPEQLAQFQAQLQTGSPPSSSQSQGTTQQPSQPASQGSGPSA